MVPQIAVKTLNADLLQPTTLALIHRLSLDPRTLSDASVGLEALIEKAVLNIASAPFSREGIYCGHSGGKDSVVVRFLTDCAIGPHVLTLHTPKPKGVRNEVHPATRELLYNLDRPVLYLPLDMESPIPLLTQIDGTRRAEASRRDGRDVGVIIGGQEVSRTETPLYLEKGMFGRNFIYPIYDWTDEQVWATILLYSLPISREYFKW